MVVVAGRALLHGTQKWDIGLWRQLAVRTSARCLQAGADDNFCGGPFRCGNGQTVSPSLSRGSLAGVVPEEWTTKRTHPGGGEREPLSHLCQRGVLVCSLVHSCCFVVVLRSVFTAYFCVCFAQRAMPPPPPSLPAFVYFFLKMFVLQFVSCVHAIVLSRTLDRPSLQRKKKVHLASHRSSYGGGQIHWPEETATWQLSFVAILYGCRCALVCTRSFSPLVMLIMPRVLLGDCPKGGFYEEDVCDCGACGVNADLCIHGLLFFFLLGTAWARLLQSS